MAWLHSLSAICSSTLSLLDHGLLELEVCRKIAFFLPLLSRLNEPGFRENEDLKIREPLGSASVITLLNQRKGSVSPKSSGRTSVSCSPLGPRASSKNFELSSGGTVRSKYSPSSHHDFSIESSCCWNISQGCSFSFLRALTIVLYLWLNLRSI